MDDAERSGGAGRGTGQQHQSGGTGVFVHHVQVSVCVCGHTQICLAVLDGVRDPAEVLCIVDVA